MLQFIYSGKHDLIDEVIYYCVLLFYLLVDYL